MEIKFFNFFVNQKKYFAYKGQVILTSNKLISSFAQYLYEL